MTTCVLCLTCYYIIRTRAQYDGYHTYESMLVGDIVGQLEFVEGDNFLHPLFACRRRVWMNVHPFRHFRVGLPSNHPARVVKFVPAIVNSNYIHEQNVLRSLVQARHLYFKWRKHSPETTKKIRFNLGICP